MDRDDGVQLPPGLVPLFDEASAIADASPASACALLRLLVRAMLKSEGLAGRDLRKDLEEFSARSGDVGILRALDVVGLSDAAARRPGEIQLIDGHSDVQNLSVLVAVVSKAVG